MYSDSVAEQGSEVNPFDEGALCNSPTPLFTSTAKKTLNTIPCTSYTQEAAARLTQMDMADQSTGSVFKHPAIYCPGGAGTRQSIGKRKSDLQRQQKPSGSVANVPPALPPVNEGTKLDTSVVSELSNTSSMGLLPDDLLDNAVKVGDMLLHRESNHFTKAIESRDLSDIEQARRCPAENSYKGEILKVGSHLASAHAFLQSQGINLNADGSQPRIVLGDHSVSKLDRDFGLGGEDTMFDGPVTKHTPVKMALNDVGTRATRLIKTPGSKQLEEFSFCSSLGMSIFSDQSFSLEKMLHGNKPEPEEKSLVEEMCPSNKPEPEVDWGNSQTISSDPFPDNNQLESTKLYDEDPFQTELAYRTDFETEFPVPQNELSDNFASFASAAAKLDADEAEFFGENADPHFDDVLQVPLAHDVSNWSIRSHISFSDPSKPDRMSLGTYMQTRSECTKNPNQSMFNSTQAGAGLPVLEEEEDDSLYDMAGILGAGVPMDGRDAQRGSSPPPVLTESVISNSLISNILDMDSSSMSKEEMVNRYVAQLDKRQRSRSGPKREIPSRNSLAHSPTPGARQSNISQASLQSTRVSGDISVSSASALRNSIGSSAGSTQTLIDEKQSSLEELECSGSAGTQDYQRPVATSSNPLPPSSAGVKFLTPRESMYVPKAFKKTENLPDQPKLNCHLKFDVEGTESVIGNKTMSSKSPTATGLQTNAAEVASHDFQNMSVKSARGDARLSQGVPSHVRNPNDNDSSKLGAPKMSIADLTAVLSTTMSVADARKIQAILMNGNHEGDHGNDTSSWNTMMEDIHGQTQINSSVFSSTLLEHENPSAGVKDGMENFLASVGISAPKRTPKFEVTTRMVKIPGCTIGISEKAEVTIRNLADRWLECHVEVLHLFVNGREVSVRVYNPFQMKDKLVLAPMATQNLEVVFFPKDPGSYMAELRISSGTQASVSPNHKTHQTHQTHDDDHMACYVKLNSFADLPSIHFPPKVVDFGQQSWGSTGCLPIAVANKSMAKVPLRLVISSKSSHVFRWGPKTLPDVPGSESKYTVVSDTICCVSLPGAQAGCVLDMTSLDIICDLNKKCALKDPNQSTSLIGVVEIQLDVPSNQPPIGIIQLVVMAGTAKLHVSNGADLIVMETSIDKPANRAVTLRNAGTLDLHVALDISRHEQVFTLDSGYLKIPIGEKAEVNITFHPQDNTVKSYSVEMMMFMEPSGPVFGIPVHGKVLPKSQSHPRQRQWLRADLSHLNFGGVRLGQPKEISLRLKNTSSSMAKIELIMCSTDKVFKLSTKLNSLTRLSDSKSVFIQPNEVYPVTIAFNPTRSSVFNGRINIKSSDESTRSVIPLLGYGGLSETFLAEPRSGVLKITPADSTDTSSQTANFTLQNSGIRDAFFSVQIYEDSEKSVLANKEAFAIHPQNGILKCLEKATVTLLCTGSAMSSRLPVHVAIYHGDEEARQQMKRAIKKFPNQRCKWPCAVWFDAIFTSEEETQNCDSTLSQTGDLNNFFAHLSTLELTVELGKKVTSNGWSYKKQKSDLSSNPKQTSVLKVNPDGEMDKENFPTPKVGRASQVSSQVSSETNEVILADPKKIWRLVPEQLSFVSKDPKKFSIINFGAKSLNFQLSWATDRMSVSNSVLTINPLAVSEISVTPYLSECWEGSIYVTADTVMQKVSIMYKGQADNSTRPPLQSKSDLHNYRHNPSPMTSPGTVELPQQQQHLNNSVSNQPFHPPQTPGLQPQRHSSGYNKLTPTNIQQPSIPAVRVTDCDTTIEQSPVNPSREHATPTAARVSLPFDLGEDEGSVDVRMGKEIIQFHVESGCDLVSNYLEFSNYGKTSVYWTINNRSSFPYVSSDDGKRTVLQSYEIFKIFQMEGTLSAGQTSRVHLLFYPEMRLDKKFVCYHACELICQQMDASSPQEPSVIPFLLQGFLRSDRGSLDSLTSESGRSMASITSSVASSTGSNPTSSSCSCDQKLVLRPNLLTFQPCPIGRQHQLKVEIKNRNSEPVKMTVEGLTGEGLTADDVFSVSVKSFTINPKKMVKFPIGFKPNFKGFVNGKIIFSSGTDSLILQLFGVGV